MLHIYIYIYIYIYDISHLRVKTNYDISRNCDRIFDVVGSLGTGKIKEIYFDCLGRHEIVTSIKALKPYLRSVEGKKVKLTLV